jgi:cell shape-determining protein MreC
MIYPYSASNNQPQPTMSNKELAQENEELKEIILNITESLQAVLEYINDNVEIVDEEDEDEE